MFVFFAMGTVRLGGGVRENLDLGSIYLNREEERFIMSIITALAVSIGLLGGLLAWLLLGPLGASGIQLWAAFIAWASYYSAGGKEAGLKASLLGGIWGAIMGWAALMGVNALSGSGFEVPVAAAISVGVTVFLMILGANIPALASIPSAVYGYASTAAFALLAGKLGALTVPALGENPLLTVIVSFVVGSIFAYVSEKIAGALAT